MNPPPVPNGARRRIWPLFFLAGLLAMVVVAVTGCFRMSRGSAALRDSAMTSLSGPWKEQIEFNAGPLTMGLAGAGLNLLDLDPELVLALQTLRGAEVGVYKISGARKGSHGAILIAADEAMLRRGYERTVGVIDGRELVAIYTPREMARTGPLQFCLLVLAGDRCVVAGATTDVDSLLDLAPKLLRRAKIKTVWREQSPEA